MTQSVNAAVSGGRLSKPRTCLFHGKTARFFAVAVRPFRMEVDGGAYSVGIIPGDIVGYCDRSYQRRDLYGGWVARIQRGPKAGSRAALEGALKGWETRRRKAARAREVAQAAAAVNYARSKVVVWCAPCQETVFEGTTSRSDLVKMLEAALKEANPHDIEGKITWGPAQ